MSESSTDKVKETIQKVKEAPVSSAIGAVITGARKALTLGGFISWLGEKAENISSTREQKKSEAIDTFSQKGGAYSELPTGSPLDMQILWGRKSVGSLFKMKGSKLDRAVQVNFEKAPCDITTVENGKLKVYKKGTKVDTVLNPGTEVSSTGAFRSALKRNVKGRFGLGTIKRWVKGAAKFIAAPAIGIGAAITTGSIVSGLLSNIGAPAFLSTIKALSLQGILAGTFSFTGVGAALLTAVAAGYVGYKVGKYLMKLVPKDEAKFLYARDTESDDIRPDDINQYLSKDSTLRANHYLRAKRGMEITQEGDIVLSVNMRARDIGARVRRPDGRIVSGFYDATGRLYQGSENVPAGTTIPHGTQWINRGVIPAGSKYSEVKPYTQKTLKEGTLKESIRIDVEEGVTIPAPLQLNTGVSLPFSYTDMSNPARPRQVRAGEYSPPGSLVDIRKLPKGTELPAGTIIRHEVISEGEENANTTQALQLTSAVVFPHTTRLRRDITVGSDGILIPMSTTEMVEIPGQQPQAVNNLQGNTVEVKGKSYKRYTGINGVLFAGSLFPADSKLPPRARLTVHSAVGNNRVRIFPINQRFTRDIALDRDMYLETLAINFGIHPNNIRIRVGDNIPGENNPLPNFQDPENPGTVYPTGQPIPAGTCIPAYDISGRRIRIPEDMVIPGGSEIYDGSTRRPETQLTALLNAAITELRTTPAANIRTGTGALIAPDQYRPTIEALPDVAAAIAALQASVAGQAEAMFTQLREFITGKVIEVIHIDITNAHNELQGLVTIAPTAPPPFMPILRTPASAPNLHRAYAAINEAGEQTTRLRTQLQMSIISRIRNIATAMINTNIPAIRATAGWAGGTFGQNINAIKGDPRYGVINDIINEVTENAFEGDLEPEARTNAQQQQRNLRADLQAEVNQVAQP